MCWVTVNCHLVRWSLSPSSMIPGSPNGHEEIFKVEKDQSHVPHMDTSPLCVRRVIARMNRILWVVMKSWVQSALPKSFHVSLRFLARVLYYGYYLACPFIDVITWFMWWDLLLDGEVHKESTYHVMMHFFCVCLHDLHVIWHD